MICKQCGFDFEGNFCSNCGAKVEIQNESEMVIPPLREPFLVDIAGVKVDANLVIRTYGLGLRKIGAYYFVSRTIGANRGAVQQVLEPIIDHHIMQGEKAGIFSGCLAQMQLNAWVRAQRGYPSKWMGASASCEAKPRHTSARQRIKENKRNAVACCPKCGSTSLSANKKGFGIGKGLVGAAITGPVAGPIGLVAGNINARKVWVTCLNCGKRWKL